jgi:hypothetical protein
MTYRDIEEWKRGLQFFYYNPGHGGFANDGETVEVKLRCSSQKRADELVRSIRERVSARDGLFWDSFSNGVLTLSFAGADGNSYSVTKADFDRARRVEPALVHLKERLVHGLMLDGSPPLEPPAPVLLGGAFGNEVRLLKTVTHDMLRTLEETWRDSDSAARSRLEGMLGSIRQLIWEGYAVSICGEQFVHLRTELDFEDWAARYLPPEASPEASPKEEPPAPVAPAEPPPAPASAKRRPWSGTWDEAREIVAGIPCSRLVLVSTEDGLAGEVWEFLEDGHRPGLVLTRSLSGRFLADGRAYWATMLLPEAPDSFYVDLVQGCFSGDTFLGTAIRMDMDGKVRRKQPLELRRSE